MPVNTNWIKRRLEDQKLTQEKFAKMIGLDPGALSRSLRGERKFKPEEIGAAASILRTPVKDLLSALTGDATEISMPGDVDEAKAAAQRAEIAAADRGYKVPIVGTIATTAGAISTKPPTVGLKKAPLPPGAAQSTVALRIDEGAMRGWLVYFVPRKEVEAAAVGRLSVVNRGGKFYLRIVEHGDELNTYSLRVWPSSATSRGAESVALLQANPVTWIRC